MHLFLCSVGDRGVSTH